MQFLHSWVEHTRARERGRDRVETERAREAERLCVRLRELKQESERARWQEKEHDRENGTVKEQQAECARVSKRE